MKEQRSRNVLKVMTFFVIFFSCIVFTANLFYGSEDKQSDEGEVSFPYQTVETSEGLIFRAPRDMPIEKKGNVIKPLPSEEYTFGKIEAIKNDMAQIERRLERIEKSLGFIEEPKEVKKKEKRLSA